MQHTKEPWPEPYAYAELNCLERTRIRGVADFIDKADADRARSCVNACAGIEDVSVVSELIEALEKLLANYKANEGRGLGIGSIMRAKTALKKAKGNNQ